MEITEFLKELEADPKNLKRFTGIQEQILADGSADELATFLTEFFKLIEDDPSVETYLIQVGHKARTNKDPGKSDVLYTFLGRYYLDKLGNREKAEIYLRNVTVSDGNRAYLTDFYVDFYAEKENWRRLEEFLGSHMTVEEGTPRGAAVKKVLAEIAERKNRPEKAVAFLQAAWQADESDAEVATELKRLYREIGKWHSLIDLLEKEIAALAADANPASTETRTALNVEVANIYRENVGSDTKAVAVYQAILEYDSSNLEIIETLAELYSQLQRWADLVQVLRKKHDALPEDDVEARIAILMEIGVILVEKYSKAAEAVLVYEEVLEADPEHLEALAKLKHIYESRRDYERLIDVMLREIGLEEDGELRFEQFVDLARMANERVRKMDVLIGLWAQVLEAAPEHAEAIENLERFYERQKDWEPLAGILEKRVALAADATEQLRVLEKLATVRAVRLKDEDGTIEVYRSILTVDEKNRKAIGELKKIYLARSDWASLEWLYRNHGTLGDLLRVLESRVSSMERDEDKVSLLFSIASLWLDEMEQTARAVRTMEQVLTLDPANVDAAARLIPIYRENSDWEKLIGVCQITLNALAALDDESASADDRETQLALHVEVAGILEGQLSRAEDAFFHWADAFRIDWRGNGHDVKDNLYRLADSTGHQEELVLTLIGVLEGNEDISAEERQEFYRDIAVRYDEALDSPEDALLYYGKLLDLRGDDLEALMRCESIYIAAGDHEALSGVLARRIPLAGDYEERRELRIRLAETRDEHLDDLPGAVAAYQEILDDFPADFEVIDRLSVLYLKGEDWSALRANLDAKRAHLIEAGEETGARIAELYRFQGMLCYSLDGEPGEAIDAYEKALEADPGREDVVELLEQLVGIGNQRRRVSEILAPIYLETERWERLADAYGLILKQTRKKDDRQELLAKRGQVFREQLERYEDAYACYFEYFEGNPANAEVRVLLYDLAGELGRDEEILATFEAKLKEATSPDVVVELSYLVARGYTERLDDPDTGSRYFKDILDIRPDHEQSLDALEAIYQAKGRFAELIEIYRKKAELSPDDAQRIGFYFRLARVTYEHLDDRNEAIAILHRVLDMESDNLDAWRFLDRIYFEAEDWTELRATLERTIPLLEDEPDAQIDTLKRLATLLEVQLEAGDEAVEVLQSILAIEPHNDYVIAELERFFSEDQQIEAVLDILEPHYAAVDAWQQLVAVLERRILLADSAADKVALHYRVADIFLENGQDAEAAFEHVGAALRVDPERADTLDRLDGLLQETGDVAGLVDLLEEVVEKIEQMDLKQRVYRDIADKAADVLEEPERAIVAYQGYLEIDPSARDVVDRLADLLEALNRSEELIAVLRTKAELSDTPDERRDILLEVARITKDVLERPEDAITVYEEIYSQFPEEPSALDALQGLYTETEAWGRLVWTYDERLRACYDRDEKKLYLNEKAVLYEQFLDDSGSAISAYREVLELDPEDIDGLHKLDELYTSAEDWPSVVEILEQTKPLVGDEEAGSAEFRIGSILSEQLDEPGQAISRFEAVLQSEALHDAAIEALRAVFFASDYKERVFEILAPIFTEATRYGDLVALREHLVSAREEAGFQREQLEAIALLQEEHLEDLDAAFDAHARCLALDPSAADVIDTMTAFAERSDRLERLIEALTEISDAAVDDPDTAYFLRQRVAGVLKNTLGDFDRAVAFDVASLEAFPQDSWFLADLDELYVLTEDHEKLAAVLALEIAITDEVDAKVALVVRRGALAEEQLGDLDMAFEAYRDLLDYRLGDETAVARLRAIFEAGHRRAEVAEILEPIYVEVEDWDSVLFLAVEKLSDVDDADEQFATCIRIGDLYVERKQDIPSAIHWYGEGFKLRPWDLELERQLDAYAEEDGAWTEFAGIILATADRSEEDNERRVDLLKKGAHIQELQLGQLEEALATYLRVHEIDPDEADALDAMARIYEALERWDDLAATYTTQAATDLGDDERIEVLTSLARLQLDRIEDMDLARATWQRILEIDDHQRDALSALADIYELQGAHEDRYRVLEASYEVAETDDDRVAFLGTMSKLLIEELDRAEEAARLLEEILAISPTDVGALHLLQGLLEVSESWARLVEILQLELQVEDLDEARSLALNKEVATVALDLLDDPFLAQEAMERALVIAPSDHDAVQFLRRVYRENAQFEKLRATVASLLAMLPEASDDDAEDARERTALYEELGEIDTEYLHNPDAAISTWSRLLEVDADNEAAIRSLEKLYREEQRWADYVTVLERKLALLTEHEDLKMTLLDMGTTYVERLGEWEQAALTYERLLDLDESDDDAYGFLERIYEEHGHFEDLARTLERKLHVTEDTEDKVYLYERLGRIHDEKLLDSGAALGAYQAAFDLDKTNAAIVDELEKIATNGEQWPKLFGIYKTLVEHGDEDRRVEFLQKAARLAIERLDDVDNAVELYEKILEIEAENEPALRALMEIFQANELWTELIGVLKKLAEVSLDPTEKSHFQNEVARLTEEQLGDRAAAIEEYRATLDLDELDPIALGALERLYRETSDHEALIQVLFNKVSIQPENEAAIKIEIGEIYETKLDNAPKAVETYEEILSYHPQHRHALERLEELYAEQEDWRNLAEVFERLLFVADAPEERLRVCQNLAVLQETEFNDKENAVEYYLKIREIDANDTEAIGHLDRLYRDLEQWEDVARLDRERMLASGDPAEQERLQRDLAELYLDKLEDLDNGLRELRAVLKLVPGDETVATRLTEILEREDMWEDVIELLDFLASVSDDVADRIDYGYRKAEILRDELYREQEMEGVLEEIITLDASQTRALELLGNLAADRDDYPAYVERLKDALDRVDGDLSLAWIHTRLGVIEDAQFNETDQAIENLERALSFMPDYIEAIEPLAEIYVRKEQWESAEPLLNLLLRRYEESANVDKQCELYSRIGRTAENLMDTERALVFYKKATAINEDYVVALIGLARLNYKKGYLEQAERYYNDVLAQAELDLPMEEQIQIFKALGDIALKQGDADKAGEYLQRVVDYNPDSEDTLEDLATFMALHEDWENHIRYKRDLANLKDDPLEKTEILLSIGDLYKEKLKDIDSAVDVYREVIVIDPSSRSPYLRLVQLFVEAQRFEDAVVALEEMNHDEEDAERRSMNYMMAAELYRTKLDMPEEAIGFYNKALDQAPHKLEAFRAVDEILTRAKSWKRLEENYLQMVQRVRGNEALANVEFMLYKNLGEIYRSRLQSPDYAISAYQLAVKLKPTDVPVHEILADLYERMGKVDQAIEEHRGLIVAQPGRIESYRTLFRLFNDHKQYDKAWCMAGILSLLKKANDQEQNFYRQSRAVTLTSAKRPVEEVDVRENVFFQGENRMIGEVFQIIYQIIGPRLKGRDLKDFGLKKKHAVDIERQTHPIHDILAAVNRYLRIPLPTVYRSKQATGIRIADTNPPALVLGEDLYQGGKSSQELAYMVGKYASYFHPLHRLAALYPDPLRLKVLYLAAEYFCAPEAYEGVRSESVEGAAKELAQNSNPSAKRQLTQALQQARATEGGKDPNVDRWMAALEYSAMNVGFVACNDIEVSAGLERDPSLAMSSLNHQDKVRSLVLFAISRKYETLTERLGIQIQSSI